MKSCSGVKGTENFKPGDEIMLHIKAKVGQPGEDGGMADMEVIRVTADQMDSGAMRERAREPQVSTEGTGL